MTDGQMVLIGAAGLIMLADPRAGGWFLAIAMFTPLALRLLGVS